MVYNPYIIVGILIEIDLIAYHLKIWINYIAVLILYNDLNILSNEVYIKSSEWFFLATLRLQS